MKSHNLFIPALGTMLTFATGATLAADVAAQVPRTAAAQTAADLISSVERAITGYVAACVSRDARGLNSVTTEDVRIEYALDTPGTYFSLDANSLIADCAANTPADNSESHVSNLWIFPTHDSNAVFVQYDAPAGSAETLSHRQLALVEMRGDRISRMLNFAAVPSPIIASAVREAAATDAGRAAFDNHCRTCHSVKEGDHRLGPSLYRIFGAEAGSVSGHRNSAQGPSGSRIIWDETTLDRFIANPDQVISNNAMKPYSGITDAAVRRRIVEFLKWSSTRATS